MLNIKEVQKKIISTEGGEVRHFLKDTDDEFQGFGEIYFSKINKNIVRAWKYHEMMKMNLTVLKGSVLFVFFDEEKNEFREFILNEDSAKLLSVDTNIWYGFKGIDQDNLIVNFANIKHNESEMKRKDQSQIDYNWK